ncbi:MAG: hypothetical protein NTY17_11360 [Planctomycetia bacterium]|nr:hypothetical protein [Planctomycetia bacterium]
MESTIDAIADPLRETDGAVFRGEDQADWPRLQCHAATGHLGAEFRHRIERAGRHGVDEQRALGNTQGVTVADAAAEHGHLSQSGLHQPAAGEAGCFGVCGNLDINVDAVSAANACRQVAACPDQ